MFSFQYAKIQYYIIYRFYFIILDFIRFFLLKYLKTNLHVLIYLILLFLKIILNINIKLVNLFAPFPLNLFFQFSSSVMKILS